MLQVVDIFYAFFDIGVLVLSGICCMFESLLEAFFLSLMSYAFAFAGPTRPSERAASIVLHALRLLARARLNSRTLAAGAAAGACAAACCCSCWTVPAAPALDLT